MIWRAEEGRYTIPEDVIDGPGFATAAEAHADALRRKTRTNRGKARRSSRETVRQRVDATGVYYDLMSAMDGYSAHVDELAQHYSVAASTIRKMGPGLSSTFDVIRGQKRPYYTAAGQGGTFTISLFPGRGWSMRWSDATHEARIGNYSRLDDAKHAAATVQVG